MRAILFAFVVIAIAAVLGTRRIGWSQWQFWAVNGLVGVAVALGRFA